MLTATLNPAELELGIGQICMRLLCAMLVGMVIGTEREYTNRPAGMRTHILVALGACAVMITGQLIFAQYRAYGASSDPARLSAQVITGVGFLGAGTILREGTHVKGLTTAASLWAVACLGIAAGGGYYAVALIGMGFIFVTLTIFEIFQARLMSSPIAGKTYLLDTQDISAGLDALHKNARRFRCDIHNMSVWQTETGYRIAFNGEFNGFGSGKRSKKFLAMLLGDKAVSTLQLCDEPESAEAV